MTMMWSKPRSTLTRYKKSGSSVKSSRVFPHAIPGSAVRLNISKHGEVSTKHDKKAEADIEIVNENPKTKLRSITSKVVTYRHEIYSRAGLFLNAFIDFYF